MFPSKPRTDSGRVSVPGGQKKHKVGGGGSGLLELRAAKEERMWGKKPAGREGGRDAPEPTSQVDRLDDASQTLKRIWTGGDRSLGNAGRRAGRFLEEQKVKNKAAAAEAGD